MPEPVPEPTAAQIVTVSDIVMETTDSVTTAVAADSSQDISNAKWAATLLNITTWNEGLWDDGGNVKKVGSIEFFEPGSASTRLDFRNMIRRRYGYSELLSEQNAFVISSLRWFGSPTCP